MPDVAIKAAALAEVGAGLQWVVGAWDQLRQVQVSQCWLAGGLVSRPSMLVSQVTGTPRVNSKVLGQKTIGLVDTYGMGVVRGLPAGNERNDRRHYIYLLRFCYD